jgi:hypothetical protein
MHIKRKKKQASKPVLKTNNFFSDQFIQRKALGVITFIFTLPYILDEPIPRLRSVYRVLLTD